MLELGVPGELGGDGGVVLGVGLVEGGAGGILRSPWASGVDRSLPSLILEPGVELEVAGEVLDDLRLELILGGAPGNEILGVFFVEVLDLDELVRRKMPGEPGLAAFGFAAYPVAHDEALVCVALLLDDFVVVEEAAEAAQGGSVGADAFDAEVEVGQARELRDVDAGTVGGSPRRADRRYVVMGDGVGVESDVVAEKRQTPGEAEVAEAGAGIVARVLLGGGGVIDVEEALEEGVESDGLVARGARALAAPDDAALEGELEVGGGAEGEHLRVHPGIVGDGVAFEGANEEVVAGRTQDAGDERDVERLDAVDAEGVDVLGVVAIGHGSAVARPKPGVGFAKGDFVVAKQDGGVGLLQGEGVDGLGVAVGDGVLDEGGAYGAVRDEVGTGELVGDGVRVGRARGGVLVLAANEERETAPLVDAGEAGDVVEAFGVGTAVVVDECLAQVETVAEVVAGDAHEARVDGVEAVDGAAGIRGVRGFVGEVGLEACKDGDGFLVAAIHDVGLRLLQHVDKAATGPGTHGDKGGVEIAHGIQAERHGIEGAVDGNVRGAEIVGGRGCGFEVVGRKRRPRRGGRGLRRGAGGPFVLCGSRLRLCAVAAARYLSPK